MRDRGDRAEAAAAALMRAQGLQIISRNYRCRLGELDIVALEGQCLVVVEVRQRSNPRFTGAAASVDRRKQQRIFRATQQFLQQHPQWQNTRCRFDVIAFEPTQSAGESGPVWIRGAFGA